MTFELHETIRDALYCGMVFLYKYKLVSLTLYLLLGSLSSFLRLTHECPGCPNLKPKRQSNEDCDDDETKDHRAELLQSLPPVAGPWGMDARARGKFGPPCKRAG